MGFMFVIYMFLSNNTSSGDIDSLNLPCFSFGTPFTMVGIREKTAENKGFNGLFDIIKQIFHSLRG